MDKEQIKQVESSLLTEIEQLRTQRHRLLSIIQNALVSLAIIHMPVREDNLANIATNNDLLKVMADSFRQVIAEMKQTSSSPNVQPKHLET